MGSFCVAIAELVPSRTKRNEIKRTYRRVRPISSSLAEKILEVLDISSTKLLTVRGKFPLTISSAGSGTALAEPTVAKLTDTRNLYFMFELEHELVRDHAYENQVLVTRYVQPFKCTRRS